MTAGEAPRHAAKPPAAMEHATPTTNVQQLVHFDVETAPSAMHPLVTSQNHIETRLYMAHPSAADIVAPLLKSIPTALLVNKNVCMSRS